MDPGLYMRIGSETKTFTVTAVLQLVDQGKVALDDPIGKFVTGVPNGDAITIRQLAGMRSGLPSYSASPEFAKVYVGDPQTQFTSEQLLAYAYQMPILFAPGTEFDYSNTNTVLLGTLVEKLSGQNFPDYLEQNIFDPVGLTSTSYPTDAAYPSPHAQGYTVQTADGQEAVSTDWNPSWGGPAGAMISTLDDLAIWAPVLADGTLLEPATQEQRLQVSPLSAETPDVGYGLGLFTVHGWIGHNGSLPGYQSLTIHRPDSDTSVVVLLNTDIAVPVEDGTAIAQPSTLMGDAITSILTPDSVFTLPNTPVPSAPGEIDDGEN
jgi:D-alanyl-D-alanine carboxypeptidase